MAKITLESGFNKKELVESLGRVLSNHIMKCVDYAQTRIIPDDTDINDTFIIKDLLTNLTKTKEEEIMEYKYDYTEWEDVLNNSSPQEIAARLDRVAVFMTRCCMAVTSDESDVLISDLPDHIKFIDQLSYDIRNINPAK